jgi:hypothetical protein
MKIHQSLAWHAFTKPKNLSQGGKSKCPFSDSPVRTQF